MKMTRLALSAIALAASTMVGCNSSQKTATSTSTAESKTVATASAVNARCPIAGENLGGAPAKTVAYHGKTVGFCCPNCAAKWEKLPDAEKDAKLASAMK